MRQRRDRDRMRRRRRPARATSGVTMRARGRRDRHDDAIGAGLGRLAPAEHRIVRAPRRQPVDLRAHDAVEELGGALRQFERPEHEALRLQHELDPAAAQRRRDAGRDVADHLAVGDAHPLGRIGRGRRRSRLKGEQVVAGSSTSWAPRARRDARRARARIVAATTSIQRDEAVDDLAQDVHRTTALGRSSVGSSSSSRHDKTR